MIHVVLSNVIAFAVLLPFTEAADTTPYTGGKKPAPGRLVVVNGVPKQPVELRPGDVLQWTPGEYDPAEVSRVNAAWDGHGLESIGAVRSIRGGKVGATWFWFARVPGETVITWTVEDADGEPVPKHDAILEVKIK